MALRRQTLHTIVFLGIANHTVLAGSRVAVLLDALGRGASAATVGVLTALYALFPMLLAVAVGRICDRKGVRQPMIVACVVVGVGAILPCTDPGLVALFASAALVGAGFMVFQVATQHSAGVLGEVPERPRNFSLLAMGYSISGFVGPLVAGFGIDHAGYPATFALFALLPVVVLAVLWRAPLALPGPHPEALATGHGNPIDLLRHRALRRAFLVNVMFAIGWDLHMIFIPIYGARIGLSASEIGIVLAAFAAATFAVRIAVPWIGRRWSEPQVLSLALLVTGVVFLAFPLAGSLRALLPLSVVLGLALGSGQPLVMSLLHRCAPAGRTGEAAGLRMSLVQSMAVAVPLAFGALVVSVGIGPVFWFVGGALVAGGWWARPGRDDG